MGSIHHRRTHSWCISDGVRTVGTAENRSRKHLQAAKTWKLLCVFTIKHTDEKHNQKQPRVDQSPPVRGLADGQAFSNSLITGQSVIITRRPGTCPGTRGVWRAAVTAGQQNLAGLHSLLPPTMFLPGGATTRRDLPAICWLVGRDLWKTQSLPAVPSCISNCEWGIRGHTKPVQCYWRLWFHNVAPEKDTPSFLKINTL